MKQASDSTILELFGKPTRRKQRWKTIVARQQCPYTQTKCFKVRKSEPSVSIGTCTLCYSQAKKNIIICPNRLLERRQVFTDCLHLLTLHQPGNEWHVVPEVSIPGGSVDYFLASTRKGKVKDFVAVEFQTLDTTGTVWPERQRLLRCAGISVDAHDVASRRGFGINWKMTAKTILVQLHHKVETLEHIGKRLVLVIQDDLLDYLRKQFRFQHLTDARIGDAMHVHSYALQQHDREFCLDLDERLSTDAAGVATCLGLKAETKVDLEAIIAALEKKITEQTRLTLD